MANQINMPETAATHAKPSIGGDPLHGVKQ
ncbi:hypothetical protein J2Z37_001142 [Ammoniphilus resinae]|uniref:Uncharacterized protein n=1 Tax=Ammoniphilus resinae TaxID=861532 RepID=A0ABS4GLJ3_9BACL|nr:hypothetical protein [Ammoniphilus resinae]